MSDQETLPLDDDLVCLPGTDIATIKRTEVSRVLAADENGILAAIAAKVAAYKPDMSTRKGRDACRSLAAEIASAKQNLDKLGFALTETSREFVAGVNAERKLIKERMQALQDTVRAPLTEIEEREAREEREHEDALAAMQQPAEFFQTATAAELQAWLDRLQAWPARDWKLFAERARDTLDGQILKTTRAIATATKREADAAELNRLREAEAQRIAEQQERDRQEARRKELAAAAETARQAAEAEAARLRAEDLQRQAQEAEKQRLALEAEKERAAQMQRDHDEAIRQAEQRRLDAIEQARQQAAQAEADRQEIERQNELRRIADAARAERERLAAIEAERQRAAAEAAAQKAADEERAKNKAHRLKIATEILEDMVLTMSEVHTGSATEANAIAKALINAATVGKIRHCKIQY